MKIGFDAKRLFNNFTGLGNYSRTLVWNLARQFPDHEYFLFTPKITDSPRIHPFLDDPGFNIVSPGRSIPFWRTRGMIHTPEFGKLDIFHGLSHELPVGITSTGVKSVVTMHDLIFKYFPQDYNWFDRLSYELKFRSACARADRVIAISEQTKRDLVRYYSVDEEMIQVIYQSCDPTFNLRLDPDQINAVLDTHGLPEEYLLYVGSVIRRKNLGNLLKALKYTPGARRLPLVVIGEGKSYKAELERWLSMEGLADAVIFRRGIPFSDFPAIYQGARIFVFPSYHEGFGIPIIEALHSRVPVITSNRSALPEAGGKLATYIDPDDPASIARAITDILENPAQYAMEEAELKAHLARFNAQTVTRQLMDLYRSLMGE